MSNIPPHIVVSIPSSSGPRLNNESKKTHEHGRLNPFFIRSAFEPRTANQKPPWAVSIPSSSGPRLNHLTPKPSRPNWSQSLLHQVRV